MSLENLFTTVVEIQDMAFEDDEFGQHRKKIWSTTATVNGFFDSNLRKSDETYGNRDQAESDGILFLPATAPLLPTSRVVIDGNTYQVYGIPAPVKTPSGVHHTETRIKRFSG